LTDIDLNTHFRRGNYVMAKKSDWKIVATEGATVDGRNISPTWIKEMADSYSLTEYAALIWPEHNRSNWSKFEGNNWGIVEELKAEKQDGLLRLFAKITPNEHLLTANSNQQKLFTSIEPNTDYKGTGKCYLTGLAVTDSPASTGTTPLKFSKSNGEEITLEISQLEEIEFSECNDSSLVANAFATLAKFFKSGGELPEITSEQEEPPMNKEQFEKIEGTLSSIVETQTKQQAQLDEFSKKPAPTETPNTEEVKPEEGEQFSKLTDLIQGIADSQSKLETEFAELKKEVPGQENQGEGQSKTVEAL
jgi:hypothetical protein